MTGGEIIRKLRLEKKLTQRKLADIVGISYIYIHKIENGKDIPSEELIYELAKILEYPEDCEILVAAFGRISSKIKKFIIENPHIILDLLEYIEVTEN